MSGHIAERVTRQEMRDAGEERVRKLSLELELAEDFDPYMYLSPGPVAQAFLNSTALTNIIMGPLGGGKTTVCMFKRMATAAMGPIAWHPVTRKPTRMCRAIVLRDTFRQTEKTVLASWQKAFPKGYPGSTSHGGNDRPYVQTLNFIGADGVRVEAITEFAGLGEQAIGQMLKGSEYSLGWLNEVDTHADQALDDLEGRLGRYPSADRLLSPAELQSLERDLGHSLTVPRDANGEQQTMRMLIGDMNAPTLDNWTYPTLVTNLGAHRRFFQQPGGLDPEAENIFALPGGRDYYQRIADDHDERYVRRMVHNKFGYSLAGKPVHPGFDHERHVASSPIPFSPSQDLVLGIDASTGGLSPAAIFSQLVAQRIRFLDECYLGHGVGAARFADGLASMLQERYPNVEKRRVKLYFDPAAQFGADKEAGELNAAEIIAGRLGLPILIPGNGSNELALRLGAVDAELRGHLEPNSWLWVSPTCKIWIEGAAGKYRFRRKPEASSNEYDAHPEKTHPYSDVQDAGQYAIIGHRGHQGVLRGLRGENPKGGGARWSSQDGEGGAEGGWKSQRGSGFDPHRSGA